MSPEDENNNKTITKKKIEDDAFGTFISQSDGAWQMTPEERCLAKCRQKERERGVRRINEHCSIIPDDLVNEFIAAIESWMKSDGEMSEMPTISCGKVVKFGDAPKYEKSGLFQGSSDGELYPLV